MNDFQLKLILSILGGVVFSFIFILLAFVLPIHSTSYKSEVIMSKSKVGIIANSARNR